jgi:tetratricopeptide (TPR) repeat protein
MRIYALLRPLTREERLQEMSLAPNDLVGRDAELADLHAAYYTVVGSGPGLGQLAARVVSGELGIGKTALATTFLNELPPDARILRVECSPARSEVPFAAVAEWIRELTGTKPEQSLQEATERVREALGQFAADTEAPEIISRLAELVTGRTASAQDEADHALNRQLVATGLRRFFARAALEAPLVVVLDGLQWCDTPSLKLVAEFLRSGEPLPVLVLLIARPDDHVTPYIDGLVRIELRGLSAENQIRLLQARLGVNQGVAQVCADLLPRAGGNPFFLLEMVDALLERGLLEIREGPEGAQELARAEHADTTFPLPSTLEQLIADRLAELPAQEQVVIDWLAVAGGPLADRDLRALVERDSDESVARLCARGLCDHRGETIDVRHPLTRDVAYLALDKQRREAMHRQLGEHLAETPLAKGLTAAIIARHLARGRVRTRAADFYLEAAAAARGAYQTRLARRYYQRVAALLPDDDLRRLEAHEALEAISRNQGRSRDRRRHLLMLRRVAKLSKNPYWVATALLRTARYNLDRGHLAKALVGVQRAEKVSIQAGMPILVVQGQALMAEVLRDVGDMQGALAAVDRALGTTSSSGVPARLRAEVLRARGTLLRRVGRVDESVNDYAEAIAVFRRVGARRMEARAKSSLSFAMYVLGRFEDGVALALDAIRIDLSIGGRFQIASTLSNIGQCYAGLGDLERGLAYLRRACEAHERYGDQDSRADTLLATAEVLIEAGDVAAAESLVRDAGALTAVTGSAYDAVHEKILRAVLARESKDPAAAVMSAFDARQAAEAQAYAAFHFYAMAIESAARVEVGEQHTGILLATTAMGAIETLQGSEYGLLTRVLCCEALLKTGSLQAEEMLRRGARYVSYVRERIRDPELLALFARRRPVEFIAGRAAAFETANASEPGENRDGSDAARPRFS